MICAVIYCSFYCIYVWLDAGTYMIARFMSFYKLGVTFWVWSREVSETQPSHHLRSPNSPVLDSFSPHWAWFHVFGTFPLLCHVHMPNGRLAYVLPPVTYSHRFSTIFILPWFVCTRMDIVPCAGAMYNISNRNEPFPFRCGPFPFFVQGYIPNGRSAYVFASHDL